MANGHWWGTKAEWDTAEAPLVEVDPTLLEFATEYGCEFSKNKKDWPERSMTWGTDVKRLIQLFLTDAEAHRFNLWLCAYEDRDGKRYWKQDLLVADRPIQEFRSDLPSLLRQGREIVEGWAQGPLDFAATLPRL